jgi:hypothetical protein
MLGPASSCNTRHDVSKHLSREFNEDANREDCQALRIHANFVEIFVPFEAETRQLS